MKVLILHSRYLSGDASGENRVVEDEARLLREGGHDVRVWQQSPTDAHGLGLVKTAGSAIWSRHAASEAARMASEHGSDVAHCHNLIPALSPAVLRTLSEHGIPVVVTLHNYRLMCLPSTFLRDNRVCEDCLGRIPWRGIYHRCYRDSFLASTVMATTFTAHRIIGSFTRPTLYLAVSDFVKSKYVEAGFEPSTIRVKSNFSWPTERRKGAGDYFLFAGRLSPEKGVDTLIRGWQQSLGRLVIAGDGPQAAELKSVAPSSVEFLGLVPGEQVSGLIRNARALLIPSIWYEAQPRIILEAYAAGVPVLASRIGGLPELVKDGRSGFLLPPGDSKAWAAAAGRLQGNRETIRLGTNAWELWRSAYGPETGLRNLEETYEAARGRMGGNG